MNIYIRLFYANLFYMLPFFTMVTLLYALDQLNDGSDMLALSIVSLCLLFIMLTVFYKFRHSIHQLLITRAYYGSMCINLICDTILFSTLVEVESYLNSAFYAHEVLWIVYMIVLMMEDEQPYFLLSRNQKLYCACVMLMWIVLAILFIFVQSSVWFLFLYIRMFTLSGTMFLWHILIQ